MITVYKCRECNLNIVSRYNGICSVCLKGRKEDEVINEAMKELFPQEKPKNGDKKGGENGNHS